MTLAKEQFNKEILGSYEMEKLQPDMIIYWFKGRVWSSQKPYLKPKERKLNTKHGNSDLQWRHSCRIFKINAPFLDILLSHYQAYSFTFKCSWSVWKLMRNINTRPDPS